jgi:hypothetical protein
MDMLCAYTDLALELNPQLPDKKYAQQTKGRIQILPARIVDIIETLHPI